MKNKKFSIEVIEEGRLSRKESNEIIGGVEGIDPGTGPGDKVCNPYQCSTFAVACTAIYTNCGGDAFKLCYEGDVGYGACLQTAYSYCFYDTTSYKQKKK